MSRHRTSEDQQDLSLSSGGPLEGLGAELQQRQHELIQLQRQQQELEIRKKQLEELNTRRMELMQGQKEIRDSLHRGVVILERAEGQSRKEVEQMHETRQIFSEQLAEINNIDPSEWSAAGIEEELSKALAKVDQAQAIYTQSRAKIDALRGQDLEVHSEENSAQEGQTAPNASESFGANLIRGFAFNLPLILAIFLGLVLFHILK